ncbi:aminopeptidase Q [Bombina bombina]|uniref:aminopeptidase Q n=1 Tax=Bombina bombina TaxID=8345 RepID=UPI00235B295D|nr:aminopeptidase Q [Bombina bombina]
MGPKTSSGFYISRTSAALLALLVAVLLLALTVLGALYARSGAPDLAIEAPGISSDIDNVTSSLTFTGDPTPDPTERPGIWNNLRLPHHLVPVHYDLELWPRVIPVDNEYPLSGQVNITIKCLEGTDIVLLHSYKLNFSRAELKLLGKEEEHYESVEGNSQQLQEGISTDTVKRGSKPPLVGKSVRIKSMWLSELHQYLVLELDGQLEAGSLYLLEFDYNGILCEGETGLQFIKYTDFNETKVMFVSKLEPTGARKVYPCFDEPALKATFKTRIVHNSSYVALSNMAEIAVAERQDVDGTIWSVTSFNTTVKMSTYITAFVVCDFDFVSTTEKGKQIRIWARKEVVQKGYADFALNILGPILSYMENLLNISYTLQKTDLVAIPFGDGAMENWGLMTFQEPSLSYNPEERFSTLKAYICLIVSHEIGHQWFGNLVTMKWWNDIWLNEGFASYMEYVGASFIDPRLKLNELFIVHSLQLMFERDKLEVSRPLSVEKQFIKNGDNILPLFDEVTYSKGAAMIRMVTNFLTEKLFNKGISSYLKTFSFSNADQDDLWNSLQMVIDDQDEVVLPASLKQIMDSWTWKKGLPFITLNTTTGVMTQSNLVPDTADNHTWIVPVTWMKNGLQQPTFWLDNRAKNVPEMKISSDKDWIILNVNITGYYRVDYDEKNWNRLAQLLEKDPKVLPVVNRVQLLEDAFVLANFGHIEYETALNLTKYLDNEDEIIVWYTVVKYILSLDKPLVTYSSFPLIKKYILKRIKPIFHHFSSVIRRNVEETADDYFIHKCINTLFKAACTFGLQECLDLSKELYAKWINNPSNNTIPESIRWSVYCYAIAEGGEEEWEFAWKKYNTSNTDDVQETDRLLHGLSCTKEPWILNRFLQNIMEIESPDHIVLDVLQNVIKNEIGRHIAWEFMKENWERINALVADNKEHVYGAIFSTLGRKATSDLLFQDMKLFINSAMNSTESNDVQHELETQRNASIEWNSKMNTRIFGWFQKNTEDADF